jgi:hypothetical protein
VAGFPLRLPGLDPMSDHEEFMMDKAAQVQVLVLEFPLLILIPQSEPFGLKYKQFNIITQNNCVCGLCPSSGILNDYNTHSFRKLDLFSSSGDGKETATLLCLLERCRSEYVCRYCV